MTRFYRADFGRIVETYDLPEGFIIGQVHPPEAGFIEGPEGAEPGWVVPDGGSPRPENATERKAREDAFAESMRLAGADPRSIARAECARRILAQASAHTQANMNAYATVLTSIAAGSRTAEQKADLAAFAAAIQWVGQMRARWPEIADQGLDPADDANWPEPSADAAALAARF